MGEAGTSECCFTSNWPEIICIFLIIRIVADTECNKLLKLYILLAFLLVYITGIPNKLITGNLLRCIQNYFFYCYFMCHSVCALIKIFLKWVCHLYMNWFNMALLCNHATCNLLWSTLIDALSAPTSLLLCVLFAKLFPHKFHIRAPSREIHSVENILSSTGIEGPFEEYNKFVKITCL